ncbi:MAG: aromatic ring-hydroxylating dioxygenase subunit alpha, partial [Actinobacteria bacterium]|nr:aromatic ring-hydroxylating dioxygenase subunit alpha [Actinomycetota bacterium]
EGADYDLAELTEVWVATSEQDWVLCEQNHAGAASRGYLPGPLSTVTEGSVGAFHSWYARALAEGSA